MRTNRFDDVSTFGRAINAMNLLKSGNGRTRPMARIFTLDGLFWRVSGLLSDLDAAVEKRLLSA